MRPLKRSKPSTAQRKESRPFKPPKVAAVPGSMDRALVELDELLLSLERPFSVNALHELLLVLDGERPQALQSRLRAAFTVGRWACRNRLRLARRLQQTLDRTGSGCAVDVLYRVILGVFPDPGGMALYSRCLEDGSLSTAELTHILALSRPTALLVRSLSSPGLICHVFAGIRAKLRLRQMLRDRPDRAAAPNGAKHTWNLSADETGRPQKTTTSPERMDSPAPTARPRIAIVVHRAGEGFSGGAERAALLFAHYLSEIGTTEILTTCARDYLTWKNEVPPGIDAVQGIPVRRFPVSHERSPRRFQRLSSLLRFLVDHRTLAFLTPILILPLSRWWMRAQGPISPSLLSFLGRNRDAYDCFVFFTYLYDTTWSGLPIVAGRAVLVPTAHPEWPLRLPIWKGFFRTVRRCIFLAEEERQFLREWFPDLVDGPVLGCGVDAPPRDTDPRAFRRFSGIRGPYLLYTGRVDPEKGCRRLIGLFLRYVRENPGDLTLVLLGSQQMAVPAHERIFAPGFVSQDILDSALAGCAMYVHPSPYESLSFSLLEAMQLGRPALVTAESDVLRSHVRRSKGGLSYRNADAFFAGVTAILKTPERFSGGAAYVKKRYSHAAVKGPLNRWILAEIDGIRGTSRSPHDPRNAASLSR